MTQITISAHPCDWQLAFSLLDQRPAGPGKARTLARTLDAISERVHPGVLWPNPRLFLPAEELEKIETRAGKKLDPSARVEISFSPEQADFIKEQVKKYLDEAGTREAPQGPGMHVRALLPILDQLEAPRE